jgi:hypothetical protein
MQNVRQSFTIIKSSLPVRLVAWAVASVAAYFLGLAALHDLGWPVMAAGAVALLAALVLNGATTRALRAVHGRRLEA